MKRFKGRRSRRGRIWPGLAAALLLAAPAGAVSLEGAVFPTLRKPGDVTLELHRAGLLRWLGLVKVYVSALYLAPGADPGRVLEDTPKRLEIQYLRGFSAEQFARATAAKIADNVDAETLTALGPRIDRLNALYRNVEAGDRYALTYLPGWGTELALNGRSLGRVEGADFGSAVFAIWLGRSPVDEGLRRVLLAEK